MRGAGVERRYDCGSGENAPKGPNPKSGVDMRLERGRKPGAKANKIDAIRQGASRREDEKSCGRNGAR
jgi:hypothetical protein